MRELMDAGPARPRPCRGDRHEDRDPGCRRRWRLFRRAAGRPWQRCHLHRPWRPCRRRCGENGLRVLSPAGDLHLDPVRLHEDWRTTGLVDIVLVAVKMYDLDDAAAIIKPLLTIDTAVVPFQNGVEAQAILESALGRRYVCGGAAYIAAAIEAPGVIRHTGKGARLVFGEPYRQPVLAPRDAGSRLLRRRHRLPARRPTIAVEVWRKFVFLAPFAGITCFGRTTDRRGPRGSAAVAPVRGHWSRKPSPLPAPPASPCRKTRRSSASTSPASCRPR